MILTVSKMEAEKRANPGYRAFFANGFNVTRVLVLFGWEVILERVAAMRQTRRNVRRAAPRPQVRAVARCAVRRRARPDRVRRAHRHDARAPGRVRDVLELRRGRPPFGSRARRHDGGASQARPALRPHQPRPTLRAAALQARRALRPRADAGRHVQAAQRLRPRRVRGALDRAGDPGAHRPGRRERRGGWTCRQRGDGHQRGARGVKRRADRSPRGRAGIGEPRTRSI